MDERVLDEVTLMAEAVDQFGDGIGRVAGEYGSVKNLDGSQPEPDDVFQGPLFAYFQRLHGRVATVSVFHRFFTTVDSQDCGKRSRGGNRECGQRHMRQRTR